MDAERKLDELEKRLRAALLVGLRKAAAQDPAWTRFEVQSGIRPAQNGTSSGSDEASPADPEAS